MTKEEFREKIGKIICPLENLFVECVYCHKGRGCPDEWPDIADKVNSIISAFRENGYVQLDDDQSLPDPSDIIASPTHQDQMLLLAGFSYLIVGGWRKVKEENE